MKSTSKQKARKSRTARPLKIRVRVRKADYSNLWWSGYTFWAREHGLWGSGADNTDASTRDMAVYRRWLNHCETHENERRGFQTATGCRGASSS